MDPNSGEVTIDLGGKDYVLKPTVGAAMQISNRFKGFVPAMTQVLQYDLESIAFIIHHGAGRDKGTPKDLYGRVFKAGMESLAPVLVRYIDTLANGGRARTKEEYEASLAGLDGDSDEGN